MPKELPNSFLEQILNKYPKPLPMSPSIEFSTKLPKPWFSASWKASRNCKWNNQKLICRSRRLRKNIFKWFTMLSKSTNYNISTQTICRRNPQRNFQINCRISAEFPTKFPKIYFKKCSLVFEEILNKFSEGKLKAFKQTTSRKKEFPNMLRNFN